ncbi:MAG: zinc-dependent metalloprotease, partial [Candidatus Solibacter sp.]|nr:zinc-dependent metalloprotease [Candidatus Solibacter sp.]
EPVGVIDRIKTAQNRVLTQLLNSARFARLLEQETLDGNLAYSPVEFLATVRKGIWRELDGVAVKVDPYRRELQRSYLKAVDAKINPAPVAAIMLPAGLPEGFTLPRVITSGDEKPMYRAELRALAGTITAAMAKTTDHETKAHLEASRDEIAKMLDPKFAPAAAPAGNVGGGGRGGAR